MSSTCPLFLGTDGFRNIVLFLHGWKNCIDRAASRFVTVNCTSQSISTILKTEIYATTQTQRVFCPFAPRPPSSPRGAGSITVRQPVSSSLEHRDDLKCNPRRRRGTKKCFGHNGGDGECTLCSKKVLLPVKPAPWAVSLPPRERGKGCKRTKGEWVKRYFLNPFSVRRSRCLTVFFRSDTAPHSTRVTHGDRRFKKQHRVGHGGQGK